MFDIGWSEMAVIALLTLIVIGPRELPRVMRNVGQWVRKAQSLARDFQRGLDDMAREAELDDAKKLIDTGRGLTNPKKMMMDTLDPTGSVEAEAAELQAAVTSKEPAAAEESAKETAKETAKEPAETAAAKETPKKPSAKPKAPPKATADAPPEAPKATIIKHPVNVAPPHSLTPPPEAGAKPAAQSESQPETKTDSQPEPRSGDGSQKTA